MQFCSFVGSCRICARERYLPQSNNDQPLPQRRSPKSNRYAKGLYCCLRIHPVKAV